MKDLDRRLATAIRSFWRTRQTQGAATARSEHGARGGAHLDGFCRLVTEVLVESGIPESAIFRKKERMEEELERLEQQQERRAGKLIKVPGPIVPGFYRATKVWDLIAVADGRLLASIEFKSIVGSFGNNLNNRAEEALGNSVDLLKAYQEGGFKLSPRPWLGYFILMEEAPASVRSVRVAEPHFRVRDEFREASYAQRCAILCEKLVRERLYDAACFLLSDQTGGPNGKYREPSSELSFRAFAASLIGRAAEYRALRDHHQA